MSNCNQRMVKVMFKTSALAFSRSGDEMLETYTTKNHNSDKALLLLL